MSLPQLFTGTLAALAAATLLGQVLRRTAASEGARRTVANINLRIASWWVLCGLVGAAFALGDAAVVALFALFSLLSLREFLAVAPGRRSLFHELALFVPLQYGFLWSRRFSLFGAFIPISGLLYIAARHILTGSAEPLFDRIAKSYAGLVVCVYFFSHAPAVLMIQIPGYAGRNPTLVFYFLLVVESSDVLQYVWGKLLGRRAIAPAISPNKTWEGFLGGILTAIALGTALWRATPFSPWQAAAVSAAMTLAGFAGGLPLSAIKRHRGIKDFGTIVAGHGGALDRIDSLCFAAPVFFYLTLVLR